MSKKVSYGLFWAVMLIFFSLMIMPISCGSGGSSGDDYDGPVGSVTGRVLDNDGTPLSGALCSISTDSLARGTYSDDSDENGYFMISNVPIGTWSLTISRSGYETLIMNVVVQSALTTEVPEDETTLSPGGSSPTPTSTATSTATPTVTPTGTATPTSSPTPSPSPTHTGGGGGGSSNTGISSWAWQNPKPQGDYYIKSLYGSNGIYVFVGPNGMIYRSTDNGGSWTKITSGLTVTLNSVWCSSDGTKWFIVGNSDGTRGVVLYSSNSGAGWTQQTHANIPNVNLNGVFGAADGTKVFIAGNVSGANGTILYSVTGDGSDWAGQSGLAPNVPLHSVWVSNDASHAFIAGGSDGTKATLLRSANQGGAWTQCVLALGPGNPLPDAGLMGVYGDGANDNRIFAVGTGGTVLYGPGGLQDDWVDQTGGVIPAVTLYSAFTFTGAGGDVVICGQLSGGFGAVVTSAAGDGSDWTNRTAAATGYQPLSTAFGKAPTTFLCAGGAGIGKDFKNGLIITSADSGASWTHNIAQPNHQWTKLTSVSALDANNVIAVGERIGGNGNGIALHMLNGSSIWNVVDSNVAQNLNSVWYQGANNAYTVGDSGTSYRWNGAAWADNNSAGLGGHDYYGIHGFSAAEYYAAGWDGAANGRVAKNQGAGWSAINVGTNQLNGIHAPSGTGAVFTVGENGTIYKYKNTSAWDSASWTALNTGVTATDDLKSIFAKDETNLYAVGTDGGADGVVYYSSTSGATWTRIVVAGKRLKSAWSTDTTNGIYIVGGSGGMYYLSATDFTLTNLNVNNRNTIKDLTGVGGASGTFFTVGACDTILKTNQ